MVETLNLKNAIHVGHSTGGGESRATSADMGQKRVAKAAMIGAIPPLMLKTPSNPGGFPTRHSTNPRRTVTRSFTVWKDLSPPFYGDNRPGAKISDGLRNSFWLQSMHGGLKADIDCIKAFSETDLTRDLKKFESADAHHPWRRRSNRSDRRRDDAPSEDHQERPSRDLQERTARLPATRKDRLNADLLSFLQTKG